MFKIFFYLLRMKFINHLTTALKLEFLGISKAFDKNWHEELTFKSKQNVVTSDLLNIFIDFLKERK